MVLIFGFVINNYRVLASLRTAGLAVCVLEERNYLHTMYWSPRDHAVCVSDV